MSLNDPNTMSNILGWIARPVDSDLGHSQTETVYKDQRAALGQARARARIDNKPWAVYKITQTHHVSVPEVIVKDVSDDPTKVVPVKMPVPGPGVGR